jgi:transposase
VSASRATAAADCSALRGPGVVTVVSSSSHVFSVKGEEGKAALDRWISWARRCRIPVFVELAGRIVRHREAIDAALDHGLSQGLIESTNTKIRLLTRIAFGFRSPEALIALAMLALGGHRPALPGRTKHPRISQ